MKEFLLACVSALCGSFILIGAAYITVAASKVLSRLSNLKIPKDKDLL